MSQDTQALTQRDPFSLEEAPNVHANAVRRWGCAVPNVGMPAVNLCDTRVTVGRKATSTVVIADNYVSGTHLTLECEINASNSSVAVFVCDNSTNGAWIRGDGNTLIKLDKYPRRRLITTGAEIVIVPGIKDVRKEIHVVIYIDDPKTVHEPGGPHLKYDLRDVLGAGAFAQVKLCIDRFSGTRYACKIVDKKKVRATGGSAARPDALMTEVSILQALQHPHIIRIYECFETESSLYMILELVQGGELYDRIIKVGKFHERDALFIFRQVYSAMNHMHRQGIIHRDLKPENILMANDRDLTIKLSDFGLSRQITAKSYAKTLCGTPQYLAPEVTQQHPLQSGYGDAVDVWSLGVNLYILLCGHPPFDDSETATISLQQQMAQGRYTFPMPSWAGVSETAKDLVRQMLQPNPERRIKSNDIANHAWMAVAATLPSSTLTRATLALNLSPSPSVTSSAAVSAVRIRAPPPPHPPLHPGSAGSSQDGDSQHSRDSQHSQGQSSSSAPKRIRLHAPAFPHASPPSSTTASASASSLPSASASPVVFASPLPRAVPPHLAAHATHAAAFAQHAARASTGGQVQASVGAPIVSSSHVLGNHAIAPPPPASPPATSSADDAHNKKRKAPTELL